ncbi:glycosyltransferase family 4 protein [Candidatus Uhrbacteria bacterium]|nr:glycosyltransferase family 4 protein [Candidatus Uhrbacteria bacterium]
MRVLMFITKSEQGGAQTHVAQLTRWLVEHGNEVAVMSPSGGWLAQEVERLGGRFVPNEDLGNTASPLRLWKSCRTFLRAVASFEPDIVACHSTMAGLIGRLSLRGRIPTIFTAHGWGFTQGAPLPRRLLLPVLERLAGRFCRRIICVSRNDLELARSHHIAPDDKLVQIYNGIEATDSRSLGSARMAGSARDDTREVRMAHTIRIFFVGRLALPKNPFLLVEAFARLDRELQEQARVTIIGDGPDRERLEELIKKLGLQARVELTGSIPREQVLARLGEEADLFVLLSRWEGFPYSILEAMAASVPVIASRVGGIHEMLEHGGGIIIHGDDLASLTSALTTLLHDPQTREHLGAAAKRAVEQHFSVEQMCERTGTLYEEVVKSSFPCGLPPA